MADTRQITPTGPGTIGGRTHSRKRAAQRRGRDLPGHDDRLLSRHTSERGVEAGQTEAGERPASFVCRDVACVHRRTRRQELQHDGGTRSYAKNEHRRDPSGLQARTRDNWRAAVRHTTTDGRGAATGRWGRRTAPAYRHVPPHCWKGGVMGLPAGESPELT